MPERTMPIQPKSKKRLPDAEARAWVRHACEAEITFQPLESRKDGSWRPARMGNISAKGIGLIMDGGTQRGAILTVMLEGPAERFSWPLLVRVVRAAQRPDGGWQVGCTFAIPLGDDELRALLPADLLLQAVPEEKEPATLLREPNRPAATHDPFLQGSVNERRRFPRRHITVPLTLSFGSAWGRSDDALAIDASLGGLKLLARHPFGRGTVLRVRSTKAPGQVPSVEVRVKSCGPAERKWLIATQFLQQPNSEIMLYFS